MCQVEGRKSGVKDERVTEGGVEGGQKSGEQCKWDIIRQERRKEGKKEKGEKETRGCKEMEVSKKSGEVARKMRVDRVRQKG